MVGAAQYLDGEIEYVLDMVVERKKVPEIKARFEERFNKPLNNNQVRYIKNKYGKDPRFNSPLVNRRSGTSSSKSNVERSGAIDRGLQATSSVSARQRLVSRTPEHRPLSNTSTPRPTAWDPGAGAGGLSSMYTPEAATLAPGAGTASSSEIMPVPGWLRNHADQRRTNSVNSPLLDSPIPVSFPYATNAESDGEASPAMSGREKNSPVTHGLPFMTPELTSSRDLLQQYSPSRHAHVNAYNSGQHVAQGARGSCNQGAEHHGGDHVGNQLSGLSLWQHGIGMPANLPHPETSAPDQSQEYGQSFLFPESTEPSDPNLTTIQQQVFPLAEHLQYQQHQPKSPHAVLECAPLGTSDPFLASMGSLPPHHAFLQEQFSPANLAFLQYYMPLLPSQTHTASSTQQALLQNPVCFSHADFSSSPRFQASHQHAGDGAASWAQAYMAASTTALPNKVPPVRVEPQPPPLATPGTMEIINCVKKTACHAPEARATVLNHERAPSSDLHKGVSAQESTSYSSANATKEEELNFTDDLKAFCHCTPDSSAHHTADPSPASSSSFSPTTEKRIVNEDVGLAELLHHEDCIDVELLTSSIAVPGQDTLPKSEQHHGIDTGS